MGFELTKEQQLIILGLIASIIVGLGVTVYRHYFPSEQASLNVEEPARQVIPAVLAHVSGAVRREGVYKLEAGARIMDALQVAGGTLPNAEPGCLNLAEVVKDGQKIIVPPKIADNCPAAAGAPARVNINTASAQQLDGLPGVGKSTAEKIVEFRRQHGPFVRLEQIMEIPRFGKAKFERIKEKLTL